MIMIQLNEIHAQQKKFFRTGRTLDIDFRLKALKDLKRVLHENEISIYKALRRDLSKPVQESFLGEYMGMLHELDTAIANVKQWNRKRRVRSPLMIFPSKASVVPEPYGQVLIIAPWNYPIDLCMSPLIGAIAAGNTVMLKPSEFTPHTSALIRDLLGEVFYDEYVCVCEGGVETARELLQLRFDYIFFTGSVSVGREVMKMAAANLTPVTLELGGKCPVIITENYNIEKAAKSIAWGKFFNAGQSCVAPDYVMVHDNDFKAFCDAFKSHTEQFISNSRFDYTRIINRNHFTRLIDYLKQGDIIYGGDYSADNLQLSPTLIVPHNTELPVMQDEIFGPVLPVITYKNSEDVISFINSREKPLVVYIFSSVRKEQEQYIRHTSSGNVCINDSMLNYVNKNLPFGGVGNSGMGKYHGEASFNTFSNLKGVHYKLNPDLPFRYPPYKGQYKTLRLFKRLLNRNI